MADPPRYDGAGARLTDRFGDALAYAARAHQGQWRKKTHAPYISHPLGAASLALEHGADEDEAIAALLHDAVEDAGGAERLREIEERFGGRVADIVRGMSDWIEGADGPRGSKKPWTWRKRRFLDRLQEADDSLVLVAASDKLHNAQAIARDYYLIGDEVFDRFTAGGDATCWYYREIIRILDGRAPRPMVEELRRAVDVFAGTYEEAARRAAQELEDGDGIPDGSS